MSGDIDVLVVGGGVVGCATLFHLTNLGYKCVLIEKNADLVSEASSGNSGMFHTGFDAPADSRELSCIKTSQEKLYPILDKLGVPYKKIGATMVAWDQAQRQKMQEIVEESRSKGIGGIDLISASELYKKEPNMGEGADSALWIPGESVVDAWLFPVSMAHHAHRRGAQIRRNCEMLRCERDDIRGWKVGTSHDTAACKAIINCAGLHGDSVDQMIGKQNFRIMPRKGQFIVYDQRWGKILNSSILQVPSEKTKGIHVFKSVYNNVVVGPTAEDVIRCSKPPLDPKVTRKLQEYAARTVPVFRGCDMLGGYTGVRPATQYKDYQIIPDHNRAWITVGGIRSTGVSGCLGIAAMVGHALLNDLGQEPSQNRNLDIERVDFVLNPSTMMARADDCDYHITHPITRFGLTNKASL